MAPTRPANPRPSPAIGDLFYGAPRREKISFLRPKDMRLGATMRGRNGQMLQFFRRRGDKNTLLDAAGAALPDDALAPFLGAATPRDFPPRLRPRRSKACAKAATKCCMPRARSAPACSPPPPACAACSTCARVLRRKRRKYSATAAPAIAPSIRRSTVMTRRGRGKRSALVSESQLKALNEAIETSAERIAEIEAAERQAQAERRRLERLRKAAPILRRLARPARRKVRLFADLAAISPQAAANFSEKIAARDRASRTGGTGAQEKRGGARRTGGRPARHRCSRARRSHRGADPRQRRVRKIVRRSAPTRKGLAGGAAKARSTRAGLRIGDARRNARRRARFRDALARRKAGRARPGLCAGKTAAGTRISPRKKAGWPRWAPSRARPCPRRKRCGKNCALSARSKGSTPPSGCVAPARRQRATAGRGESAGCRRRCPTSTFSPAAPAPRRARSSRRLAPSTIFPHAMQRSAPRRGRRLKSWTWRKASCGSWSCRGRSQVWRSCAPSRARRDKPNGAICAACSPRRRPSRPGSKITRAFSRRFPPRPTANADALLADAAQVAAAEAEREKIAVHHNEKNGAEAALRRTGKGRRAAAGRLGGRLAGQRRNAGRAARHAGLARQSRPSARRARGTGAPKGPRRGIAACARRGAARAGGSGRRMRPALP